MGDLPAVIVSGLVSGSAYALLALGIVIIFRSTDTANFAIGDMGTPGALTLRSAAGQTVPMGVSSVWVPVAVRQAIQASRKSGLPVFLEVRKTDKSQSSLLQMSDPLHPPSRFRSVMTLRHALESGSSKTQQET